MVLLAIPIAVISLALLLWRRHTGLELYTSPVFNVRGKPIRVQFLRPLGWNDVPITSKQEGKETHYTLEIREPVGGSDLITYLKRGFALEHREPGYVYVTVPLPSNNPRPGMQEMPDGSASFTLRGDPGGEIDYAGGSSDQFNATYREVCGSFKVISATTPTH